MTSLLLHAAVLSCCMLSWSLPSTEKLRFTSTFYNVTIPENSVSRTLVSSTEKMGIKREGFWDDVTFKISSGDPDRIFKVEDKSVGDFIFLVIRTRGGSSVVLNRERKDKFVLTIRAFSTRSSFEATTIVYVRVVDQNDLSPIFFPPSYNATIPEDYCVYRHILRVSAEDADLGVNGDIIYSMKESSGHFAVHPFTGVVMLTNRLKYSERSVYDLVIVAQDRATVFRGGGQTSLAKVTVRVRQVNLFGPEIYVYVLQEPSIHRLGWTYAVARVLDRDHGVHGEIDDVRIVNGDFSEFFTVIPVDESKNKTEYNIVLSNYIKNEDISPLVNLSLQVSDKGFPQRKSYKGISIRLKNVLDYYPRFLNESYEINVPEYLPQGSPLIRLYILNEKLILLNKFRVVITEGNVNDTFRFVSRSSILCVNKPLDSEAQRLFTLSLSIVGKDGIPVRNGSATKVKVYVKDFNDNSPIFNETPEEIWVNENQPAGTHVIKVTATDSDFGDNGYITFSICNLNRVPFEIDPLSGVLRTTQPLDYEYAKHIYLIKIRASDSGAPFRRETQKTLNIRVRNINDNSPVFTKGDCSLSIPRDFKVGTNLFSVTATDLDEADVITYSISSSYHNECIKVDISKGMLSLQCDLKELSQSEWDVNITANDGVHIAQSNLRIFVATLQSDSLESNQVQYSCRDINIYKVDSEKDKFISSSSFLVDNVEYDISTTSHKENVHHPAFLNLPESLNIKETLQVDEIVYKLEVSDADEGINGKVVFGLTSSPEEYVFEINVDNGEVYLFNRLNYDDQKQYFLNITVCDLGLPPKCIYGNVMVNILDSNNHHPKFQESKYKKRLPENTRVGEEVYKMIAIDSDFSLNQTIRYFLTSADVHFTVDQNGSITLKAPLDRETADTHTITVKAADGELNSNDTLYSETTVSFYIEDVNDNVPTFVNTHLVANVPEDLPIGSIVLIVNAVDRDEGEGDLNYSINSDLFRIDPSGVIKLESKLDFETTREHRVVVSVSDAGSPALSASETVIIKVTKVDKNLYPPVFEDVVLTGSVLENVPARTLVTEVAAGDADLPGPDSKIVYQLQGGTGLGMFTVTEQGQIYTSSILNAEEGDHYWLKVVAKDSGSPPLSATVEVYIAVQDVNDHLPLTLEPFYEFSVEENLPSMTVVGQVTAVDDDINVTKTPTGENRRGTNLFYSLSPKSNTSPFTIDANTGILSTTRLLDREDTHEYYLEVMVTDRGVPSLSSSTEVRVLVLDVNDHVPQFSQDHYIVKPLLLPHALPMSSVQEVQDGMADEGRWKAFTIPPTAGILPVFQVLAVDKDQGSNGNVSYSITSDSPFAIHYKTGAVYPKTTVSPGVEYDFHIKATDHGTPTRSSTARVTVLIPLIPRRLIKVREIHKTTVEVPENLASGDTIVQLNSPATNKSETCYVVYGGDGAGHSAVVGDQLLSTGTKDYSSMSRTTLNIAAFNNTHTWDIQVTVNMLDVNEFHPQFRMKHYTLNVSEDTPENSVLTTFQADDLDVNSTLFFYIHNRHPGSEMFQVDRNSGDLILTALLDRELMTSHLLTIRVSDGDDSPRNGFTRVSILVGDVNDNTPTFAIDSLALRVSEDVEVGTVVETLVAADVDSGENGNVVYSIVSGNINETFKINQETGSLIVNKVLDTYYIKSLKMIIKAEDQGSYPLETRVTVYISILPSEKKKPRCTENPIWTEVEENTKIGEVVGFVSASPLPYLTYEMVSADPGGVFSVNPTTGDVLISSPLDYESVSLYNISVSITSRVGLKTECTMIIYVTDSNDNAPTLKQESYSGFLLETAPVGTIVSTEEGGPLRVLVEDSDSGENAMFEFTIEGEGKALLSIDPITGTVRTAATLDYEARREIAATVSVRDLGHPSLSATSVASLHVHVRDVNDCPPRFPQRGYNATILLPTEKFVFVLQVPAVDPDSKDLTNLKYSIISGNEDLALLIDSDSGEIFVQDIPKLYPRRITVLVSDSVFQDTTTVDVAVIRNQPSVLRFQKEIYHAAVMENSTKTSIVAVVSLLGSFLDENIRFSVANRKRNPSFSIGPTSGIISTFGDVFDREEKDLYHLIVQAYSLSRQLTVFTKVNVSVLDVNDNCPQFNNLPYRANVMVNSTKGDFVFKVSAEDSDSGENGEVRFELDQAGSEVFRIGRKSGEIRVKNIAQQTRQEIVVKITAHDGGIIPCYSSTTLTVSLVDTSAPQWQRTVYKASVPEDAQLFSTVAVSLKASAFHKVIYQLIGSTDFLLRHDTGELQVYTPLDRETRPLHRITVRATDSVTGVSADTLVLLEVADSNDNPPVFAETEYTVRVSEDAEVGVVIAKVTATDVDAGNNGTIRYSVTNPNFKIHPIDGTLLLQNRLDYEVTSKHNIKVVATDSGIPARSSLVYVSVEVVNCNDNPPEISPARMQLVVSQAANRGFLVGKVTGFDRDNDPIRYIASSGDHLTMRTFAVDRDTGIITVANPRELTVRTVFNINISLEDGVFSTAGLVEINVLPSNREPPKFNRALYEAEVDENQPAGIMMIRVKAFDKDSGIFGNVSYILPTQKNSNFFTLDKYTGELKTRIPLDREEISLHTLDILARDGGGMISWAKVKIKVVDINDNKPSFEIPRYHVCVGAEYASGEELIKITATDSDEGPSGDVTYSVVSAEPPHAREWFHVHPTDGSVISNNSDLLDGPKRIRLTIRASDQGSPPLHSDVTVRLQVSRDMQPSPLRSFPSTLRIPPEAAPGFVIHHFKQRLHENLNFFTIGEEDDVAVNSTGYLYLKQFPIATKKVIGLVAQHREDKSTVCAFYKISVEMYPMKPTNVYFTQDKLELTIPENLPVGTSIYKVDTRETNPTVLFGMTPNTGVFSLDRVTGWVSLASPLDRESQGSYDVIILASTSQSTSPASARLTLIVTDVNDNPHIFNQDIYNFAVKEDSPVGTEVAKLTLVDPDLTQDPVHFLILEGDEGAVFRVTEDRRVVLARPLDRESQPGYRLAVAASDGTFASTATVNIVVIDVNDEPHRCVHALYNMSVSESQTPGQLVTSVLTVDPDLETSLSYHLGGEGREKFYVDNHGDLRLKQYLDRESTAAYTLEVTVEDPTHPEWSCVSVVSVVVADVNDNAPSFAVANETVMLTEDSTVGMVITRISVLDFDEGPNRSIRYSLVNPSGLFNLSSDSGLLVLSKSLPNGPGSVYYVTVRASDQGRPPLSSLSTLQIVVLGMNDDPPVYLSGTFHVVVAEDAPVPTTLLRLRSFSEDLIRRTTVVYTILEGNGQGEFDIDKRTGVLVTNKALDFETRQNYQLLILATSVGESSVTSYSSVNVSVTDVNDNAPLFKVNRFSVQIREDIEVGQIVLKIEAIDLDSSANGIIRYSLDEDAMQQFAIDSFSGILMVLSSLDCEKKAQYNISVVATDMGDPPFSSVAHVNVEVVDVNDNPPVFLTPNVTAILQADRMPGWAVFHFGVTDADLFFNSTFTFHITEGNEKEMFRVDGDGTLRTTDKLSIRLGDQHTLVVRVEDANEPMLYSSTWIYIKVVEPSKHPPVVHPLRVWIAVYENQWSGGDLGVITSSDLDPYDKLEFSVPSNPQFSVDPRHGMLKARGGLETGVYNVNVSVTDGKFTTTSTVAVAVEPLRQDMLQTSVYIRLSPRIRPQGLAVTLPHFLSTLQSAFLRDVNLISVQNNPNSTIGLLIAVNGGADLNVVHEVMLSCGLSGSTPQCDCRNGGVCQRQLQMMPEKTAVISGPGVSFVTPGHSLAYYCICSMGYAGDHCEEIKCLCPPLQVCVPQKVGFTCIPPCSANQTCPAAMTSAVTWPELLTCLLASVGVITIVAVLVVYRRYRNPTNNDDKYGPWGKQPCKVKNKSKLSNLTASQKPSIFTGSPNNGTLGRNNLEAISTTVIEGEVVPLDYLRNINPLSKMGNDILQGHSSAPDLATCHVSDVVMLEDPARELAALDDQLSQEVVQYGFPPPGASPSLHDELEVSL